MACQLRDNNFSRAEAESIARTFASRVPSTNTKGQHEPFTEQDALVKVASAYGAAARQPWEDLRATNDQANSSSNGNGQSGNSHHNTTEQKPDSFHCTDLGNAERFAARYQDKVRWCEVWNTWLVFNGKCWEPDKSGRVDQLAKATVRAIYREAADELDEARRKQLAKHAAASESNRAVRAMLDRAKSELPAMPEDFNTHLYLLNCENGTLDLRTGELRPHNPHDMLTRCIKYKYNPLARSKRWEAFLEKFLVEGDLITFMQQALGMSLCGDISEQCLFICHGMGSNGKTTMLETVRIIMGSYACAANIETFQVRKNETIGNDIAELYGARMVTASETRLGGRLNEAFVKKATGKEPLRARRLHENEFEFMPELTLWLAVNHKPIVLDTSKGMWRRVHFVPFNVTIDGDQVDKHFGDKLLEEAEGILAWLVQGCRQWIEQGHLSVPQIVQEATAGYRAEMDIVANFLEDECILGEGKKVTTKNLIARFEAWCGHNSEKFDARVLKTSLKERGYYSQRGHGGSYYWQGVGLKDEASNAKNDLLAQKGEGNSSNSCSEGEGGEGGEGKNQVNLKSKNPPDANLNSRSPRSPRSPSEHKNEQNSEGTFTQEDSGAKPEASQMCQKHPERPAVDKQKRCEECHLEFLASLEEPEDNPLPAVDEYYCDLVDGGSDDDGEEVLL
jgi:putative DNA primase/helicase